MHHSMQREADEIASMAIVDAENEGMINRADTPVVTVVEAKVDSPEHCPRCGMGYAAGRGYNAANQTCNGCGYNGKRIPA